MPVSYELEQNLQALTPVLDEHAEWYMRLITQLMYPDAAQAADMPEVSNSFLQWCGNVRGAQFIEDATLDDLMRVYKEMHQLGRSLLTKTLGSEDRRPPSEDFKQFNSLYEGFVLRLRRLEHDCAAADSGIDVETGLRNVKAMKRDVQRELERRERRGNPFTLALAQIDSYDFLKDKVDSKQMKAAYQVIGRLIRKCIRTFDDGYRLKNNEFVMCLKHSVAAGGTAAVSRLNDFLDEEGFLFEINIDGEMRKYKLSMSYCVAEPVPGDTLDELLKNMRQDLARWREEEGGTALEYVEVSPLQRYISEND